MDTRNIYIRRVWLLCGSEIRQTIVILYSTRELCTTACDFILMHSGGMAPGIFIWEAVAQGIWR